MNYIIYNNDGSIKNVNFADIIVQGNNLVDEIFVAVEGRSTDSYLATAYFELPNGDSNFLTATLASRSIDQSAYNGYKFLLTGAQTAFYGRVRMSIKLEGMQGETLWTYDQVLTINKSGYNPDFTMISMSQYAALLQAMGSLQEKYVVNNARFYSSLANAQADLDNLAFNQCVIIADVTATDPIPEIYFKNSESQLELLAGIGEYTFQAGTTTTQTLAPGSDATVSVSFVASGKTITMNFTFGIPKGDTGATGNGIASIAKVGTVGLVDTYRITFTDGSHFDYDLTNGTLAGKMVSNESFTYDSGSSYTLSEQLARFIYGLIEADKNKLKQIVAYQPNNGGPGDSYNIVWRYANSLYGGGAGNFYYLNDSNGSLITIDGHLESYKFSIFYEDTEITVAGIGYFELSDTDLHSGTLTAEQAAEAAKDVCFIYYNGRMYYPEKNSQTTRVYKAIPHLESGSGSVQAYYEAGQISIALFGGQGIWSYAIERLTIEKTPTQNSSNLVTSGGVHSAIKTASDALDAKILAVDDKVNYAIEAITKKDDYQTQEATFQGMTPVPAGAMVKAYLDGFKGNSAVVNQLVQNGNFESTYMWGTNTDVCTLSVSNNIATVTVNQAITTKYEVRLNTTVDMSVKNGDSHYFGFWVKSTKEFRLRVDSIGVFSPVSFYKTLTANTWTYVSAIVTGTSVTRQIWFYPDVDTSFEQGDTLQFKDIQIIDLTLAGLTSAEMADVATAKSALKHKDMDVDSYIPYNAGTLTDSKPTKLISRGFNLWDEQVKTGLYNTNTGVWSEDTSRICSKDPVLVSAGAQYYIKSPGIGWVLFFKEDNSFISAQLLETNRIITTPNNCHHIHFDFSGSYGTVYKNDTCVNLSNASLNGTYKPHVPAIEYDLTMPNLKSAGSVQDESKAGGSLVNTLTMANATWNYQSTYGYFYATINDKAIGVADQCHIICDAYVAKNASSDAANYADKSIYEYPPIKNVGAKDTAYTDVPTFTQHLSDVNAKLNYAKDSASDFSDPISYPEIFDVEAGGSIEVVSDGCDATTKVYFYVEA